MTVTIGEVGRGKKSWSAEIPSVSAEALERSIRKHKALGSRFLDFELDDDGMGGTVLVGGWRPVGRFRVEGGVSLGEIRL